MGQVHWGKNNKCLAYFKLSLEASGCVLLYPRLSHVYLLISSSWFFELVDSCHENMCWYLCLPTHYELLEGIMQEDVLGLRK